MSELQNRRLYNPDNGIVEKSQTGSHIYVIEKGTNN